MNLALVTCAELPQHEVDDHALCEALVERGAKVSTPSWTDPDVDWATFDACLIRTTWDYMDKRDRFLRWATDVSERTRLFNPLSVVRWNTHKTYLRDLADRGVPIAETLWLPSGSSIDIAAAIADRGWSRALIKPMIGACARETLPFVADDPAGVAAAQAHIDRLLPQEGLMVQPFLQSVLTEGEYSVVFIDGGFTHAIQKVPVPGDYRVMDDFGATDEPAELTPADLELSSRVRETCEDVLGRDRPLLYARVDLLRADTGDLLVNEVELVEPSLFFRHSRAAATRLAEALLLRMRWGAAARRSG